MGVFARDVDSEKLEEIEGLRVRCYWEDNYVWAGLYAQDLDDTETGAEFKARAQALIEQAGLSGNVDWIEEAWRDG
jgi:hypothetical protein